MASHFSPSPRESVPAPTLVAACQPPVHGQVVQVQVGGGQTAGVGVVKHLQRRKRKIITRDSRALSGSSITHIYLVKWNFVMKSIITPQPNIEKGFSSGQEKDNYHDKHHISFKLEFHLRSACQINLSSSSFVLKRKVQCSI